MLYNLVCRKINVPSARYESPWDVAEALAAGWYGSPALWYVAIKSNTYSGKRVSRQKSQTLRRRRRVTQLMRYRPRRAIIIGGAQGQSRGSMVTS